MTPLSPAPQTPATSAQWLRLHALLVALTLAVLLPFALWGDAFDQATPVWLGSSENAITLALVGIVLLVADVLLPVPSSVVGMALCWALGPLWGGISFAAGLTLAFAFGYTLGRMAPEQRLRQWIGAPLWDNVRQRAHHQALWWIVASRPLPLLAEMSALLAGVWRVPALPALAMAALSSCGVAALYAASVSLGKSTPGLGVTLLATMALPSLTWSLHRVVIRRLQSKEINALAATAVLGLLVLSLSLMVPPPASAQALSKSQDTDAAPRHTYYDATYVPTRRCFVGVACMNGAMLTTTDGGTAHMSGLRVLAVACIQSSTDDGIGRVVGLRFEHIKVNGRMPATSKVLT